MKKTASTLIIVLVLTSFCYFLVKKVKAIETTELFAHGFEGGNFGTDPNTGYAWTGVVTYSDYFIVTDTFNHTGTYSATYNNKVGQRYFCYYTFDISNNPSPKYYAKAYLNLSKLTTPSGSTTAVSLFGFMGGSGMSIYILGAFGYKGNRYGGQNKYNISLLRKPDGGSFSYEFFNSPNEALEMTDEWLLVNLTLYRHQSEGWLYSEVWNTTSNTRITYTNWTSLDTSWNTNGEIKLFCGVWCNPTWTSTPAIHFYYDDVLLETPVYYYFNFNFYDLDSEDVEIYVDWALFESDQEIVNEGFESWNPNNWVVIEAGAGLVTPQASGSAYSGSYGCNCTIPNQAGTDASYIYNNLVNSEGKTVSVDMMFKINSTDIIDYGMNLMWFEEVGTGGVFWVDIEESEGHYYLGTWNKHYLIFTEKELVVGTWYNLIVKYKPDTGTDGIEYVKLDDVVLRDFEGQTSDINVIIDRLNVGLYDYLSSNTTMAMKLDMDEVVISLADGDINYTEGASTLEAGTYYLKTSKYDHLINTTTLDTDTYGNSTININLNMKRHESCPNGFITSNDTISSISIYADTPQLLNFTMQGDPPDQHGVGVPKNASYILEDGVNMTDWTYEQSPSHIHWNQSNGGAELLFDGYSETNKDEDHPLQTVHPSSELQRSSYGQTFKTSSNNAYKISKVKFYLRKYGTPTGNLIVRLYAHTGTFGSSGIPTGSSLANGSSFSIASLTTSYQLIEFTFSGTHQYLMELNTAYCIQLEVTDGVLGSGNYVMVGADFSTASHEGNQVRYLYSAWAYETTKDTCFYLYGIDMTHDFALVFPSTTGPVSGPHTPINHRLKVMVRLNNEWLKGCNVTVEGGPDNRLEWALTDLLGTVKFKLRTGSYEIVANYEQYSKTKTVHVSSHMTIGIDLTEQDIIRPLVIPEDVFAWIGLPEFDLTKETFLVLLLPLIALAVYVFKKASEGGKRKWKYSYLR